MNDVLIHEGKPRRLKKSIKTVCKSKRTSFPMRVSVMLTAGSKMILKKRTE